MLVSRMTALPGVSFIAGNRDIDRFRGDASFVYRCENIGKALVAEGGAVRFVHIRNLDRSGHGTVSVFHRPRASLRLRWLVAGLRRLGPVVADFDDLVFDPSFSAYSPGVLNGLVSPRLTRWHARLHRLALPWFDKIVVSTEPLAEHVRRLLPGKSVSVVPNAVHRDWRHSHLDTVPVAERERCLTYFPGTRSHDRDFAVIKEPLSRFLRMHPDIKLRVTGRLAFDLDAFSGQVIHEERVPFEDYMSRVRSGWVNLAPLEETPFNRCKSALKVMEAGYWEIPTVCSPNVDVERFAGAGAWIAKTPEQWLEHLEQLLDDDVYRQAVEGLRERVLERAAIERISKEWRAFVEE